MDNLLKEIQMTLKDRATPAAKIAFQKFVPGSQHVYGVRLPIVNGLAKTYKAGGFVLAEQLWRTGAFEEKLLAAKLIGKICKKDPHQALQLVRKFSGTISDWAVCDTLGTQSLKPVANLLQKEIFDLSEKLSSSKDLWQRRLSLVLVEVFTKDKTLHSKIKQLVRRQRTDDEYYVKKAVAWIDRNLAKHEK